MATTPPPPDRPTQPLRPIRPEPPVVEERYVAPAGVDTTSMLLALEDAVGALRTWLAVVGLVAVAALGIGIYALMQDDDDGTRGSRSGLASDERVSRLDDRVDRLSRQLQTLRAGTAAATAPPSSVTASTSSRTPSRRLASATHPTRRRRSKTFPGASTTFAATSTP